MSEEIDVIIVGGGCAGLTAALYCARAGLKTYVFAGDLSVKGGMLMKTSMVENYPGIPNITGFALMTQMEEQAVSFGAKIHY